MAIRLLARRRKKHRRCYGGVPVIINRHNLHQKQPVNRRTAIELPERLDLEENYEATVTNLTNVRRATQRQFVLRYLSFEKIRHITPSAALLLASEIDRWNDSVGRRVKAKHATWDTNVKHLLCEMGFFELIHLERPKEMGAVINTKFLPFIRGNVEDKSKAGQLAKQLRLQIEAAAGTEIRKHLLFDGLSEAITNVCQHAYTETTAPRVRPWWMFAAYVGDSGTVVVSFYDHGKTIPGTLPASKIFERMKDQFGAWDDGQRIKAAMELGRSSSGQEGRGKGLQNFLEVIKGHTNSKLRIYSNRGLLEVTNSSDNILSFDSRCMENPLKGTLIEWQFVPNQATALTDENIDRQ